MTEYANKRSEGTICTTYADIYAYIYNSDIKGVKELVNSENVNHCCPYNGTLLSFAVVSVCNSNYGIVDYLLEQGANPNVLTPLRDCTLIEYANLVGDAYLYGLLTSAKNKNC